jgi:hypothetical protein
VFVPSSIMYNAVFPSWDELHEKPCAGAMTAIISTFVPSQGFVIGTDGRQKETILPTGSIDDAQKIFFVERPGISLAYAWAGITRFSDDRSGREFSLLSSSQNVWKSLNAGSPFVTFIYYFAEAAYNLLTSELGGSDVSEFPPDSTFCKLLCVGYYHNRPYKAQVWINSRAGELLKPIVRAEEVTIEDSCTFSFPRVFGSLKPPEIQSIQHASDLIRDFIKKAVDDEQDDECRQVGGTIRVASVTPTRGCEWVEISR